MYATLRLRAAALSAWRATASHPPSKFPALPHRGICAVPAAPQSPPKHPPSSHTEPPCDVAAGGSGSRNADVRVAGAAGEGAKRGGAGEGKIPDVPSTSLGFEDPDANDPLKWKKFAFKYAGALLVFGVSYKGLHWYVERLEKDGKRRREEVEENKSIIEEMNAGTGVRAAGVGAAGVGTAGVGTAGVGTAGVGAAGVDAVGVGEGKEVGDGREKMQGLRIFDAVKEEEPHLVSELEELHVYRIELERRLRDLEGGKRSREGEKEKWEVRTEMEEVDKDIAAMDGEKVAKKS